MESKSLCILILFFELSIFSQTTKADTFVDKDIPQLSIKDQSSTLKSSVGESTESTISNNASSTSNLEQTVNKVKDEIPSNNNSNLDPTIINSNETKNTDNSGLLDDDNASNFNNTKITKADIETINSILKNVSINYPELSEKLNSTLKNINLNNTAGVLINLNKSLNSSVLNLYNETDIKKTVDGVKANITKAVLQHQAETALKDLNTILSKSSQNRSTQLTGNWNSNGSSKGKAPNKFDFNPSIWLSKLDAPWKHVSENHQDNSTEVIQACKFGVKVATCSAEYTKWNTKVWFEFAEAPSRNGINLTVFEHGHKSRVTFYNKVNGTDCQIFKNGSFHQICLKVYGYDKDLGPTRVCLEFGAALFNHGVAAADYGCFRFGIPVIHEEPFEGETPPLILLNSFILGNQYFNLRNVTTQASESSSICYKSSYLVLFTLILALFK